MKFLPKLFPLLIATVLAGQAPLSAAMKSLDLSGEWKFVLDPQDLGLAAGPSTWNFPDTIKLPGTTAAQGKGQPLELELNLQKPAMQHLHQRHPYLGPAWYQRTVTIPADWKRRDVILTLERVLWESRVWVDQEPAGEPQLSLSAPHRYDLTSFLTPGGTHTLTVRIDNRQMIDIGKIGHAYTEETQTIWNGVIGDLKLDALPPLRSEHARVRTLPNFRGIEVDVDFFNSGAPTQAEFSIFLKPNGGKSILLSESVLTMPTGSSKQTKRLTNLPADLRPWSEFEPTLHEIAIRLKTGTSSHILPQSFGLRTVETRDRHILINGNRSFLRGNLECAIFPATGHPDAEGAQWDKIMRTSREWGLNHLRFHSWCPPEAAFAAADQHGIYLQVELPNWTFKMGQNPPVDAFLKAEGERIIREFGHHPSFLFFSLGNELKGDLPAMDALLTDLRELAPNMLYTSTSYAFSPRGKLPGPNDDFFISQETDSGWVRGQGFLNTTFPSTNTDYANGLECLAIPLVTHEVGQYVVYPDLSALPKYDRTPLRATALEAIRSDLVDKNLQSDAARFTRDSGKLAALLYKEDIERALRTKDLAGIQLLQLQDFPGQSTATVGLLDAFWDSKGLIEAEQFRQFCSPVVPLARMDKFVWTNKEVFTVDLELANFGATPLDTPFTAQLITPDGTILAEELFDSRNYPLGNGHLIGRFETSLALIKKPTRLTLQVAAPTTSAKNSWPVWVYPSDPPETTDSEVITHRGVTKACLADLASGKSVLLLPPSGALRKALPARFIPVFWSPLHFPNQPGTLGATIDAEHPLWTLFPTDTHTNWQWWELLANSHALDLGNLDAAISKPFRFVDKYNRNAVPAAIFEARVGPGKLLVCTLDVESDLESRIVARQLRHALEAYANSPEFAPPSVITKEQLIALVRPGVHTVTANSSHPDFPASSAIDGNPATFWHSDWRKPLNGKPSFTLDLLEPQLIRGLRLTARPDMSNGRIATCVIEYSADGMQWSETPGFHQLPDNGQPTEILFSEPKKARYLRVIALSSHHAGNPASIAEIEPLSAIAEDVRDLGIVPGFND